MHWVATPICPKFRHFKHLELGRKKTYGDVTKTRRGGGFSKVVKDIMKALTV